MNIQNLPRPVYSRRGFFVLGKPCDVPVLTVECYEKWYGLCLIQPDGRVEEIGFEQLEPHSEGSSFAAYYDHIPNPYAVKKLAESQGWHLDALGYELMTGRWALEVLP